ncbi:Por secretion system C-terminal sorting domain-containing protein [Chryseolinea serpens]|uniref:Por secretion system C-terminal sorting domain-containing protein n=1 Tax=Chryseolinea serpens TaxID=947013 RepID=A0A1M5UDG2_9BACT|nr:T9SS type A sorting domain-containing protein [Chryseolinea serpens]SHH61105.1 Por secretion system C-terminal sorting domain-containing protein [Chryseolinea serpens]
MKKLYLFFAFLVSITGYAQISENIQPRSFQMGRQRATTERSSDSGVELPALDNKAEGERAERIRQETCVTCRKEFYGRGIDFEIDIKRTGKVMEADDGTIWTVKINSKSAKGFQFYFSEFRIPEGATLHIYSDQTDFIMGAFTKKNVHEGGKFATAIFPAGSAIIEYFEPKYSKEPGRLVINRIIHVFKNLGLQGGSVDRSGNAEGYGASGSCTININCTQGSPVATPAKAVALISKYDENVGLSAFCTGFLINSTDDPMSKNPYFMTAGHCLPITRPDGYYFDFMFYFNYQSTTCDNQLTDPKNSATTKTFQGAYLRSMADDNWNYNDADYGLLEMMDRPQNYMEVSYLGWDKRKTGQGGTVYNVSHPVGDAKKVAVGSNPVATGLMTYSDCLNNTMQVWKVSWSQGVTQPISSGSPLISAGRAIGVLSGGVSRCSDSPDPIGSSCSQTNALSGPDFFNRFDWLWDHPGSNDWVNFNPVSSYLDRTLTGAQYIDTYSYPTPTNPGGGGGGTDPCVVRPLEDPNSFVLSFPDDLRRGLGYSVAAYGDDIAVGAPWERKVYIYKRLDCNVKMVQQISIGSTVGRFGFAVDMYGDYLVVGDPGDGIVLGAAYIYKKTGDTWAKVQTLAGGAGSYTFGYSVSISASNIAIGSPLENQPTSPTTFLDLAYFYRKQPDGTWPFVSRVVQPEFDPQASGKSINFGKVVEVKENWAVVAGTGTKAIYIYRYQLLNGSYIWNLFKRIQFGSYSSYSDDRVAMSNDEQEIMSNCGTEGIVQSFRWENGDWVSKGSVAGLGGNPAILNDVATVVRYNTSVKFLKKDANGVWNVFKTIDRDPHDVRLNDVFGNSVALTDNYLVVGRPESQTTCTYSGSAFIYDLFSNLVDSDIAVCNQTFTGANGVVNGKSIVLGGPSCATVYQPNSSISYLASISASLKPGFTAKSGSTFKIASKGCANFNNGTPPGGRIASQNVPEKLPDETIAATNLEPEIIVLDPVEEDIFLSVFPSPALNGYVLVKSDAGEISNVELYDIKGQLMKDVSLRKETEKVVHVTIPSDAKGIFMVKANVDGRAHFKKVVFQ